MEDIKSLFRNKRSLVNILVLGILVLAIPIVLNLIHQQQILKGRAFGTTEITFTSPQTCNGTTTPCLTALSGGRTGLILSAGQQAAVNLHLVSSLGGGVPSPTIGGATATPSPTGPTRTPTPSPTGPTSTPTRTPTPSPTTQPVAGQPTTMELAEDGGFTVNFRSYAYTTNPVDYQLSAGNGAKIVFARFKDAAGNIMVTAPASPIHNQITLAIAGVATATPASNQCNATPQYSNNGGCVLSCTYTTRNGSTNCTPTNAPGACSNLQTPAGCGPPATPTTAPTQVPSGGSCAEASSYNCNGIIGPATVCNNNGVVTCTAHTTSPTNTPVPNAPTATSAPNAPTATPAPTSSGVQMGWVKNPTGSWSHLTVGSWLWNAAVSFGWPTDLGDNQPTY